MLLIRRNDTLPEAGGTLLWILLSVMLTAATATVSPAAAQSSERVVLHGEGVEPVEGLDALYRALSAAYAERDAGAAAGLYAPEAVYLPPGRPILSGRDDVRRGFDRFFASLPAEAPAPEIVFSIERRTLDGTTAVDIGYYRIRLPGETERGRPVTGKFVVVAHHDENGTWRFTVDAYSPAPPASFDPSAVHDAGPDRTRPRTIPFEFVGHLFVDATVNGRTARLLYDPVRNVMLDRTYSRKRGFSMIGGGEAGYGGPVMTGGAGAERHEVLFVRDVVVELGELSFEFPVAPVIPLDSTMATALGRHVDGLLGIDVLSGYMLEFDFSSERFVLHPFPFEPPEDAVALPITWLERRPTVPMRVAVDGGEMTLTVLLDFGMSGAMRFTTGYTDAEDLVERLRPTVEAGSERGLGGALTSRVARLPRLRAGDIALDSVVVSLARETEGADAYPEWDALVGLDLLSRFQLFLDLRRDRLWLRPNDRFDRPFEHVVSGLTFEPRGRGVERLVVRAVRGGSNADEAGFEVGDIVLSVDGMPADDWHVRHWREALEARVGGRLPVVVRRGAAERRLVLEGRSGI